MNDDGRRVIQCPCLRSAPWRDLRTAWRSGWSRRWRPGPGGELVPEWRCPEHVAPPAAPPPIAHRAPAYLVDLVRRDVGLALEQLELLRAEDAGRWRAVVDELLELVTAGARRRLEAHAKERAPKKRRRAA